MRCYIDEESFDLIVLHSDDSLDTRIIIDKIFTFTKSISRSKWIYSEHCSDHILRIITSIDRDNRVVDEMLNRRKVLFSDGTDMGMIHIIDRGIQCSFISIASKNIG